MNNFAQLSDKGSAKFLVRWRGKQEGPYPASVIESKLATNEIGLLHEIFHNGKWVTIRDYIAEREATLRAELKAREERERHAREEAEKQARGREEQRQAELLAEDRRKEAQLESIQLQQSHNAPPPVLSLPPADRSSSGWRTFGILLLVGGLAVVAYFFLAFDTSVETGVGGVGHVNNFGLMADKQNGIIAGIGLTVVGTIMLAIGFRNKN